MKVLKSKSETIYSVQEYELRHILKCYYKIFLQISWLGLSNLYTFAEG